MSILSETIASLHELQRVNLWGPIIDAEGATALADALKVNATVTHLGLRCNNLGDEGASALANALTENTSVTSIYLIDNDIGDEGAAALAEALKENTSVTNINLGYNQFGDEGAAALADALKANPSVTSINLKYNLFGDEGAEALADALKVNNSVTYINLESTYLIQHRCGAVALADALKVNTSLTHINLRGLPIGADGVWALIYALKINSTVINLNVNFYGARVNDVAHTLIARNRRLRHLFLFDARQMLLSLMCADECGVVWPYLLEYVDTSTGIIDSTHNNACAIATLRAEFALIVEERHRRAANSHAERVSERWRWLWRDHIISVTVLFIIVAVVTMRYICGGW
jgi:hypothetical protein